MAPWNRLHWSLSLGATATLVMTLPGHADAPLSLVYPPDQHQTGADRIFFIGTAAPDQPVYINGQVIEARSAAGHFAPSLPLELGDNTFTLRQGDDTLTLTVTRLPQGPPPPEGIAFVAGSLQPTVDTAYQPGETVCLGALAPAEAEVSVELGPRRFSLAPQTSIELPPNYAALTDEGEPYVAAPVSYQGCFIADQPGDLGTPTYRLSLQGTTSTQSAPGALSILAPDQFDIAEVTADSGTARTGPSTSHSRLTPLPQGTRAQVTGRQGDWLRLDYGGWIHGSQTQVTRNTVPPQSIIRSITARQVPGWTEVRFPLQVPVPIQVEQTAERLTLTLHNTVAQTDTIFFSDDPVVQRLDWRPILPDQAQYTFHLTSQQPWGYRLRYQDTTLVLSLRHPPVLGNSAPLQGATILLDPGHGGEELGARGPTGYPEKAVNLVVSQRLQAELEARGARVLLTRQEDKAVSLRDRMDQIAAAEPTLALSIHYNALPDSGDALNTSGIGAFWYHAQAHDLAVFLHDYLTTRLGRPSYGIFWNNLALTRPTVAPAVLLELGFMINPDEFEWITDPEAQEALAATLADGITAWLRHAIPPGERP